MLARSAMRVKIRPMVLARRNARNSVDRKPPCHLPSRSERGGPPAMTSWQVQRVGFVLAVTVAATASSVAAKQYPTNVCVGRKQEVAGDYCKRVLKAWARWERTGDAGARDDKIAAAAADLERGWAKAEAKSQAGGADCTDTTL